MSLWLILALCHFLWFDLREQLLQFFKGVFELSRLRVQIRPELVCMFTAERGGGHRNQCRAMRVASNSHATRSPLT